MTRKICIALTLSVCLGLLSLLSPALANEAAAIKARMQNRLQTINQLKAEGIIGENNKGLLEFRGDNKEQVDVIDAENNDRILVYKAIAAKTGATIEIVGSRRALQIMENADPGTWVQDADGKWKKK